MIRGADAVWVSTQALAETLVELHDDIRVVANGLDERLWAAMPRPTSPRQGPVRILNITRSIWKRSRPAMMKPPMPGSYCHEVFGADAGNQG